MGNEYRGNWMKEEIDKYIYTKRERERERERWAMSTGGIG